MGRKEARRDRDKYRFDRSGQNEEARNNKKTTTIKCAKICTAAFVNGLESRRI